jgi:hypothetical protein
LSDLDWRAIGLSAAGGFMIAFPGLVLGGITDIALFVIIVFLGFACAGFAGGVRVPNAPLSNGIVAALVTCVVAQAIGIALIAAKGDTQHPAAWVLNLGVAAGLGLAGASLAERRTTRA